MIFVAPLRLFFVPFAIKGSSFVSTGTASSHIWDVFNRDAECVSPALN